MNQNHFREDTEELFFLDEPRDHYSREARTGTTAGRLERREEKDVAEADHFADTEFSAGSRPSQVSTLKWLAMRISLLLFWFR